MISYDFAIMAFGIAGACLIAAYLGKRIGNDSRDVRAMAVSAAAMGGLGIALLP